MSKSDLPGSLVSYMIRAADPNLKSHIATLDHIPVKPDGHRRSNRGYPVALDISYKLTTQRAALKNGSGRSINISSGVILIKTETSLPIGVDIELAIAWPAKLNRVIALNLYVRGRTLFGSGNRTVVSIQGHEFRTRGQIPDLSRSAANA